MKEETIAALAEISARFYADRAEEFSRTRNAPWPGWERAAGGFLRARAGAGGEVRVLDAGCGNARFATYVAAVLGAGSEEGAGGRDPQSPSFEGAGERDSQSSIAEGAGGPDSKTSLAGGAAELDSERSRAGGAGEADSQISRAGGAGEADSQISRAGGAGEADSRRPNRDEAARIFYLGIDSSSALLSDARVRLEALSSHASISRFTLLLRDLSSPNALDGVEPSSLVVAMGVLHHIPSRPRRLALVRSLARCVSPGGTLALSLWQFGARARFTSKIADWSELEARGLPAIDRADLEPGDHLLRFGAGGLRYCHFIDPDESADLARTASDEGLSHMEAFEADGASNDLNRYLVLRRP